MTDNQNLEAERAAPELANCPFCASNDAAAYEHCTGSGYMVLCHACLAEGPMHDTKELAAEWWSRRAAPEASDATVIDYGSPLDKSSGGVELPPLPPSRNKSRDFEGWADVYTVHEVDNIRREAVAADRLAREVHEVPIPGEGIFDSLRMKIDPTLPPDTIEMQGANLVRLNLKTGQITEVYAQQSASAPQGVSPAEIDDMAFGYCPSGKIGELREFAHALLARDADLRTQLARQSQGAAPTLPTAPQNEKGNNDGNQ